MAGAASDRKPRRWIPSKQGKGRRVAIHKAVTPTAGLADSVSASSGPGSPKAKSSLKPALAHRRTKVQASSVWDRLSQPKKSRLHEALEAASGTKSSPELERVHCDPCPPGHGENVPIANQEFIQVESADQPAQQQAKSSLRMKLRSAVRLTLSMTRFKTRVEELQEEISAARQKADAWLHRNGASDDVKVGLAVGNWPSRFRSSMNRRRRSSALSTSLTVLDSLVQVDTSLGNFATSFKSSGGNSRRGSLFRRKSSTLLRRSSTTGSRGSGVIAPELLVLFDANARPNEDGELSPADDGELSPAVKRYLPGLGRQWLRTRGGCAVRLSREGSGLAMLETEDAAEMKS